MDTGWDDACYMHADYKKAVANNFARLGSSWLKGEFDWRNVLLRLCRLFAEHHIEWYVLGSISEAVLGVDIKPHDIDIAVHTRNFYKVKELSRKYVVEPLVDNKGNWLVQFFGKLCIDGASAEIAADEKLNMEAVPRQYEKASWNGYDLLIMPLRNRYEVENNVAIIQTGLSSPQCIPCRAKGVWHA